MKNSDTRWGKAADTDGLLLTVPGVHGDYFGYGRRP
jgi:hypothetical protein